MNKKRQKKLLKELKIQVAYLSELSEKFREHERVLNVIADPEKAKHAIEIANGFDVPGEVVGLPPGLTNQSMPGYAKQILDKVADEVERAIIGDPDAEPQTLTGLENMSDNSFVTWREKMPHEQ